MIIQIKHAAFAGKVSAWRNTTEKLPMTQNGFKVYISRWWKQTKI